MVQCKIFFNLPLPAPVLEKTFAPPHFRIKGDGFHFKGNEMTTCWVLTEGIAGTENQCIGVAEAMGLAPVVKRIKLRAPWKQLSPWLCLGHGHALAPGSDSIDAPYPDLLIASGRKSIGLALYIRRKSKGRTFVVQIQDPRINPRHFDLVVVPQHDPTRGNNVIVTKGALHRVTPEKIAEAARKFDVAFAGIPRPRVAVLIGGSSKSHRMTLDDSKNLASQLALLAESSKVGLIVTASRRTGEENRRYLLEALAGPHTYFWDGTGDNPYFALLGHADYIVVTADSASMTTEALSTGKPVFIASLQGGAKRLNKFHKMLREQGYTRPFTGVLETWSYDPPNDTMRVAAEILKRLEGRKKNG